MNTPTGPLYELTFAVDRQFLEPFQQWLAGIADSARHQQGIVDSHVFEVNTDTADRGIWTCQFQCLEDDALDALIDGFFADTDVALAQEFGDAVDVSRRTLREEDLKDLPPVESPNCLNCGNRLRGQYCGICGQRARNRLISLWQLISEAFGDLLELDSRLWRTLIPLLRRPGRLTRDYLEGRRARYMPPFRTYLVLSLIFFVVAFFDPRDDLGLLFEPEPLPTPAEAAERAAEAETAKQEVLKSLAEEGIIVGDALPGDAAEVVAAQLAKAGQQGTDELRISVDDDDDCNIEGDSLKDLPQWLQRRFTPERLKQVCARVTADNGKAFLGLLRDNIPVALIVLLPLMALVLKILYPLSRRYFVEHLLFFVHYHAFFFLMLTLQILFARIAGLLHLPEALAVLVIVAASFYIPVYLFLAMRQVYGQGWFLTFMKYVVLVVAYGAGASLTMLGAALSALIAV